jgi:hypothetical protein
VQKHLNFVALSVLVVALIHGTFSTFFVFALPPDPKWGIKGESKYLGPFDDVMECCWTENVPPGTGNPDLGGDKELYCQACKPENLK